MKWIYERDFCSVAYTVLVKKQKKTPEKMISGAFLRHILAKMRWVFFKWLLFLNYFEY
ncbi:MAG: hypothetical protein ACLS6Y_04500 [Streptococcus salivarius]